MLRTHGGLWAAYVVDLNHLANPKLVGLASHSMNNC